MRSEDRTAIADVLALYCERIDEYDVDGVVALFAPGCVVDFGPGRGGVIRGREGVRTRIAAGQAGFRRTHHQLGQSRCTPETDGRVRAVTYATASHETWDGHRWRVGLRYVDVLARRAASGPVHAATWEIDERAIVATLVEDGPREGWAWVPRRLPEPG